MASARQPAACYLTENRSLPKGLVVCTTHGGKEEESDGKALERGVSLGSTNANFNIK